MTTPEPTACDCTDPTICWGVPGETEGCDACLALDPERHCLRCDCGCREEDR